MNGETGDGKKKPACWKATEDKGKTYNFVVVHIRTFMLLSNLAMASLFWLSAISTAWTTFEFLSRANHLLEGISLGICSRIRITSISILRTTWYIDS